MKETSAVSSTSSEDLPAPCVVLDRGVFLVTTPLGFLMARQKIAVWEVDRWPSESQYPCVVRFEERYRGRWYLETRIDSPEQYKRKLENQLHLLEQHLS